jgi:gluconate kinase
MIVHLNGWPGVGKKTIGAILAQRLGARFVHNHLLYDLPVAITGHDDPARWPLYETIRAAAYDALAQRPPNERFVMTNALRRNTPRDRDTWTRLVAAATARNAPLIPIVLETETDELVRRLQSADRVGRKLTDPARLRGYFVDNSIQKPVVAELLVLDVTSLTPDAAAARIEAHVAATPLLPAGSRLLELR